MHKGGSTCDAIRSSLTYLVASHAACTRSDRGKVKCDRKGEKWLNGETRREGRRKRMQVSLYHHHAHHDSMCTVS